MHWKWKVSKNKIKLKQELLHTEKSTLVLKIQTNITNILNDFGHSSDLLVNEFKFGVNKNHHIAVIYIKELTDKKMVSHFLENIFLVDKENDSLNPETSSNIFDFLLKKASLLGDVQVIDEYNQVLSSILAGHTVILIDGCVNVISGSATGGETRSVEEPSSQIVIRGPKEGFTEDLATNLSLIRKRIKSHNLWVETFSIGKVTKTDVSIMYINGIVNEQFIQEAKKRLNEINIHSILESGNIEELIEDQSFTVFPTILNTERPDSVAANLLEGRFAILIDSTPFVLIAPFTFFQSFQAAEDYYHRYDISSFIRLLRFFCFLISLLLPSIYVAGITYHPEMIPTPLLINIAAQRDGIPFPAFIEAILMEISFEILREAGIRMPRAVGQAVSIVGALILGEAAVQAGIVSPAMVIVVALTGIASFASSSYNLAISVRMLRFMIMVFAAGFGFYGIAISNIMIIAHLCSLQSFGVPYMAPLAPFNLIDQRDTFFRFPIWAFPKYPSFLKSPNSKRMNDDDKSASETSSK